MVAAIALAGGIAVALVVGVYWLMGWRKDATAEISALRQELRKDRDRAVAKPEEKPVRPADPPAAAKDSPAVDVVPKPAPQEVPVPEVRPRPATVAAAPPTKPATKDKGAVTARAQERPAPTVARNEVPSAGAASSPASPVDAKPVVSSVPPPSLPPASAPPQPASRAEPEPAQVAATPPKPSPKPPEPDLLAEARRDYDAGRHEDAVRKARPLAERGNSGAQHLLGDAHARGRGAERSVEEAAKWFERAALQGNVDAMQWLGGHFAAQDNRYMAFVWYGCAAKLGATQAQRARDQLAGSLQPYDQVTGERAIAACVAKGKAR
jgi:hypothetical protein